MPFVYRLQKILNYRIQKKDEQIQIVKEAEREVARIQAEIDNHRNTILTLRQNMRLAPHTMMESYDVYIKYIDTLIEQLEEEKRIAIMRLEEEREKLVELEKGVKVLEKHKEKAYEQYRDEQNKAEMKMLDEVAGLKHYAKTQARIAEELEDELSPEEEVLTEGLDTDGY